MPDIEGRVIDARTGEPVSNAEVFVSFRIGGPMMRAFYQGSRWATTDERGHFAIPAYCDFQLVPFALTSDLPVVIAYHPAYGMNKLEFREYRPFPGWKALEFPLTVDQFSLELAHEPKEFERQFGYFCYHLDDRACRHMRAVVQANPPERS